MISINEQSSIRIDYDKIYYFDPYHIENTSNDADYIFITHGHYDHFDKDSISKIINDNTILIVPENMKELVSNYNNEIIYVIPGKDYDMFGLAFRTSYSYNLDKSFHPKEKGNVGYIIPIGDKTYYIAGDTDVIPEMKDIQADIWFVPIGGTYTMDVNEAADLIKSVCPSKCIPIHYGTIVGDISLGDEFKKLVGDSTEVELYIK